MNCNSDHSWSVPLLLHWLWTIWIRTSYWLKFFMGFWIVKMLIYFLSNVITELEGYEEDLWAILPRLQVFFILNLLLSEYRSQQVKSVVRLSIFISCFFIHIQSCFKKNQKRNLGTCTAVYACRVRVLKRNTIIRYLPIQSYCNSPWILLANLQ